MHVLCCTQHWLQLVGGLCSWMRRASSHKRRAVLLFTFFILLLVGNKVRLVELTAPHTRRQLRWNISVRSWAYKGISTWCVCTAGRVDEWVRARSWTSDRMAAEQRKADSLVGDFTVNATAIHLRNALDSQDRVKPCLLFPILLEKWTQAGVNRNSRLEKILEADEERLSHT